MTWKNHNFLNAMSVHDPCITHPEMKSLFTGQFRFNHGLDIRENLVIT